MEHTNTQREIILVTASGFAQRRYAERDNPEKDKHLNFEERFKAACWDGLLRDILPEAFTFSDPESKQFLWQMRECRHILSLELAGGAPSIDYPNSIDPYCFLEFRHLS